MNQFTILKKALFSLPLHLHNRQDFSRFYDHYAPIIYGHLLRQTKDAALAELLLEEVFVSAWHNRNALTQNQAGFSKDPTLNWLLRTAHQKKSLNQPSNL